MNKNHSNPGPFECPSPNSKDHLGRVPQNGKNGPTAPTREPSLITDKRLSTIRDVDVALRVQTLPMWAPHQCDSCSRNVEPARNLYERGMLTRIACQYVIG